MSLLIKAGISKLSELEMDADKNCQGIGLSNLKEVAQAMATGDTAQHDGTRLVKLGPGVANYVLTSQGPGKLVVWAPGGTYFDRFFPVSIGLVKALGLVTPLSVAKPAPMVATLNYPGPTLEPAIGLSRSVGVVGVDQTIARPASPGTSMANEMNHLMGGAVADDGGLQTDETTAANNDTANDMALLPAVPAVNDAYYFGDDITFAKLRLNQGINGAGVWAIAWEYWNGAVWAPLLNVNDETNGFRGGTGTKYVTWTLPGDWALTTVKGMNLYWVRARVSSYTSVATQAKGTRSWTMTPL